MIIEGRKIDKDEPPYIVAEISASHRGSLENALKLIEAAKEAGASAVKFQCYLPETISLDSDDPHHAIHAGPWKARRMFDLYTEAHTPREWFSLLFARARQLGITAFSTACSVEDVAFLESLHCCPAYKVASFDIVNLELIEAMVKTGKPVIISTGMASHEDIWAAEEIIVKTLYSDGLVEKLDERRMYLHCVSDYPCMLSEMNLGRLRDWTNGEPGTCGDYGTWGLSDHTISHEAGIMAVGLGAPLFEKHITLIPDGPGLDDEFAIGPQQFGFYVRMLTRAWQAMQPPRDTSGEDAHRKLRPSIHAIQDIAAGQRFTRENIRIIRPGGGLEPCHMGSLLAGSVAGADIRRGWPLQSSMVASNQAEAA